MNTIEWADRADLLPVHESLRAIWAQNPDYDRARHLIRGRTAEDCHPAVRGFAVRVLRGRTVEDAREDLEALPVPTASDLALDLVLAPGRALYTIALLDGAQTPEEAWCGADRMLADAKTRAR